VDTEINIELNICTLAAIKSAFNGSLVAPSQHLLCIWSISCVDFYFFVTSGGGNFRFHRDVDHSSAIFISAARVFFRYFSQPHLDTICQPNLIRS